MNGVLVSGLIRSGTTWIGHMLATADNTIYIHEPFNPDSKWNACFPLPSHMMHITPEYGGIYQGPFARILKLAPLFRGNWRKEVAESVYQYIENETQGKSGPIIPIIKDPVALFSAEWLAIRHHLRPVIVLRHPISIVRSQIRLGWTKGNKLVGIIQQKSLVETFYKETDKALLQEYMRTWFDLPLADQMCVFVRYMYLAIDRFAREFPDWHYVCYEDVSNSPEKYFVEMMQYAGLEISQLTYQKLRGEKGEYDPTKAHQNVLGAIPTDQEKIFESDEYSDDWKGLYEKYFPDIAETISKYVSWA